MSFPSSSKSCSHKTSLEAIPMLVGRENYKTWAKAMESHLKALRAWKILLGVWKQPREPDYCRPPLYPEELIDEHKAKHEAAVAAARGPQGNQSGEVAETGNENAPESSTPQSAQPPKYVPMTVEEAERRIKYITNHINEWEEWEAVERTAINDIYSRISTTCREELNDLNGLSKIWEKLKKLYVGTTVGAWVKELNDIWKLRGARKEGENPEKWLRDLGTKKEFFEENLGPLSWNILCAYIATVDIGDDLTNTARETHRLKEWPQFQDLRVNIEQEYHSTRTAGKMKPTASARPSNPATSTEDPELNLMSKCAGY